MLAFRSIMPVAVIGSVLFTGLPAWAETALTLVAQDGSEVEFSMEDLEALDQTVVVTANEYVDGEVEFSGPLARDVIDMLPELPEEVLMTAINDYAITVPVSDFYDYDVILALSQDGTRLSRRDKGPIWLIYPTGDFEELQDRIHNDRLIWQLIRIEAQ